MLPEFIAAQTEFNNFLHRIYKATRLIGKPPLSGGVPNSRDRTFYMRSWLHLLASAGLAKKLTKVLL